MAIVMPNISEKHGLLALALLGFGFIVSGLLLLFLSHVSLYLSGFLMFFGMFIFFITNSQVDFIMYLNRVKRG